MEINMTLFLPRDAVSVPVSRQVLDSCLETLGVTADTRADIALALSEACANVIQHAGPGEEYEVLVRAKDQRCAIEVVNTGCADGGRDGAELMAGAPDVMAGAPDMMAGAPDSRAVDERSDGLGDDPGALLGESGRGLTIIDAVTDNLQLTGDRLGTTVHFEKVLDWVPGAAGQQLFNPDSDV